MDVPLVPLATVLPVCLKQRRKLYVVLSTSRHLVLAVLLLFFLMQAAHAQSDPAPQNFTYTTVLVRYIAGTLPGSAGSLGRMGCLVSTNKELMFLPYLTHSPGRRLGGFLAHLVNPYWAKGGVQCRKASQQGTRVTLEYDKMQVLARGQVQNMSSASAGDLQLVGGIGSLLGATVVDSTVGYVALGTVAAVSLGYYLDRRTQNYITVFVKPDHNAGVPAPGGRMDEFITRPSPKGDFCKCDFAVFQVIDPHDYWNLSMLLDAKTGQSFVSEGLIKGADSSSGSK
jgi:hypothetical protein